MSEYDARGAHGVFEEYHQLTIAELISAQADKHHERIFLQLGDQRWSYADTNRDAARLAQGFQELGVLPGDRVAVMLPNTPEFVISLFACAKAGCILVPINMRRARVELLARLEKTEPKILIIATSALATLELTPAEMGALFSQASPAAMHLIYVGPDAPEGASWADCLVDPGASPLAQADPASPAAIVHTLGSSGEPRGAVLTHAGLVRNATQIAANLGADTEDTFLGAVPFSNTFGLTATILACAVSGGRLVCLPRYHPAEVQALVEGEAVTIHHGVPTMFAMELNYAGFRREAYASLRTGIMSGAPCPPELVARVREQMGCNLLLAYGLTEASPSVTMTQFEDGPITSTETVGRPMEGVEVKVIDPDGVSVPTGVVGELCVRGYNVMLGYWEDPHATAEVLNPEGWLRTGDLAVADPDGPVRIVGRVHEVIIRSGYKLHPGTIEMVFRTHPLVKDAAAVGIPDLIYGELIAVCVVRTPGAALTGDDLLAFAAERLPEYAVPDRVYFFQVLPRLGTGPVRKDYLRDRVRIRGQAWKFGRNIDTDAIIPARRCNTADPRELAQFCMEDADPQFVHKMQRGDLIVAEANFGCGSSREVAPLTLKSAGVSAVIAKSFARIFFRNAVNIGLPILECPAAVEGIRERDEVVVEPASGIIRNLTQGETYQAQPFPDFLQRIIEGGGLLAYVEARLAERSHTQSS